MLLTADYIRKSLELHIRTLQMLHVGLMISEDNIPDVFEDEFFEDLGDPPVLGSIVSELPELAELRCPEDVADALIAAGLTGLLLKVATPVRTYYDEHSCTWSWGRYRSAWFYGDTVAAALNKAYAWAELVDLKAKQARLTQPETIPDTATVALAEEPDAA